ncbi:MAG: aminoglycoside/choline kinase family phosphotransferase [Cellvibrionaceae bacterium]
MSDEIRSWIAEALYSHPEISCPQPLKLNPIAGDAGFRRYFRLNTRPSLLLVTAPRGAGPSESAAHFAELSQNLRDFGIPTPKVFACDGDRNRSLIEDFGTQSLLDVLDCDSADLLYGEALMLLLRLQQLPAARLPLPRYDQSCLRQEMQLFTEWFVNQLLGLQLSSDERHLLEDTFAYLEQQALEQPRVLVHRDFHSRNLIYRPGKAPGVIDFQDAVWGPITYDLVSLLKDCYIFWSAEQVKRWMTTYANLAIESGILPPISGDQWQYWFDCMGLQRHIKVLGIFSRLHLRDGKSHYLNDLPLVWHYVLEMIRVYPELKFFSQWCYLRLQPLIAIQPWYRKITSSSKS